MTDSSERLQKLKETLLQTEILAQFGGSLVSPEASEFVANLMRNWYAIDNDGRFETNDETPLGMDLKPLPVDQIGDYLKEKHGYLFRESRPVFESHATTVVPPPNKAQMTLAEKCQFIRVNGEQAFLDLPNSPAEAQPLAERHRASRQHLYNNSTVRPLVYNFRGSKSCTSCRYRPKVACLLTMFRKYYFYILLGQLDRRGLL